MPYSRRLARRTLGAYISDMDMRTTALALCLSFPVWMGCGGASPSVGSPAQGGAGPGGAVATAGVAAAVFTVAGGCKLQGCPYGSYCNADRGFCDVRKCSDPEGCPPGTVCNEGMDRCQAPGPPNTPNDFLPQDSAAAPLGQN